MGPTVPGTATTFTSTSSTTDPVSSNGLVAAADAVAYAGVGIDEERGDADDDERDDHARPRRGGASTPIVRSSDTGSSPSSASRPCSADRVSDAMPISARTSTIFTASSRP